MAGVQQKKNRGIGQKQKFETSKAGCSKRIAYFCTYRLTLRTPKASCLYLQAGDILINFTGDGTLGRVAQYWRIDKELTFDSNMTLLRSLNEDEAYYLGQLLEYFVRISQGSKNQTLLYCSMVRATEVILTSMGICHTDETNPEKHK